MESDIVIVHLQQCDAYRRVSESRRDKPIHRFISDLEWWVISSILIGNNDKSNCASINQTSQNFTALIGSLTALMKARGAKIKVDLKAQKPFNVHFSIK